MIAQRYERPTPCECIRRLRIFKTETLYRFYKAVEIPEPGPLGIFGLEIPEEEQLQEAIEELKAGLSNYTRYCPWKISREAVELTRRLEEITSNVATLSAVISGEYEVTFRDLIEACEIFVASAIDGIYEATEGYKAPFGPMSPNREIRQRCSALLLNIECAKVEIDELIEVAQGYMGFPEEILNKVDELDEEQRSMYKEYLSECKRYDGRMLNVLEGYAKNKDYHKEQLEKYDEWTEEHKYEMTQEQLMDRLEGRDHWLWEISEDISNHQRVIETFIETEWSNVCSGLRWRA